MAQTFAGDRTVLMVAVPQNWCYNTFMYNSSNKL